MYNNQNPTATQSTLNMLEAEKSSFIEKQSALTTQNTIDEKTFYIDRLVSYFSFPYQNNILSDCLAEAIALTHFSCQSLIENKDAQSIFCLMFSCVENNFHNAFRGIDGHDVEILFRDTELNEDFCIVYDVEEIVGRVYPATKKYVVFSEDMSLKEKVNLTRIAFLLNQFLYDRKIQTILNNQKYNFRKLKEKIRELL